MSAVTATPAQGGVAPGALALVAQTWFNPGPFGVALFFLISGLVVPFSLETRGAGSFLLARAMRIFPTYVVAVLIEAALIAINAATWGRPLPFTAWSLWTNLLLVYDFVGQGSIDLVNWTLSVELKFYLVVAALAPMIRAGRVTAVLAMSVGLFAIGQVAAVAEAQGWPSTPSTPVYTFSSQTLCLLYMSLGLVLNFHVRGKVSGGGAALALACIGALFTIGWRGSVWRGQFPIVTVNYLYAFAMFGALYGLRNRVPANAVLDWLASISFPFYLVHSLLGYMLLRHLMGGAHLGYCPALFATLLILVLVAYGLHRAVERPTQLLSHRLGRDPARASRSASRERAV